MKSTLVTSKSNYMTQRLGFFDWAVPVSSVSTLTRYFFNRHFVFFSFFFFYSIRMSMTSFYIERLVIVVTLIHYSQQARGGGGYTLASAANGLQTYSCNLSIKHVYR